ncbi:lipocalin family protein [Limibacillus sp. MBR-115]|jgi:apolipoprotein D and lipocalin family protein|uniref:lipocalin family protein n=1 Tax=Limibacillus sp. MBR-115 TaxID=3156465 RepID=UPI003392FD82
MTAFDFEANRAKLNGMRKWPHLLAVLGVALLFEPTRAPAQDQTVNPILNFEIGRYLGLWHEIASIPAWFQEDCVARATATYALAEEPGRLTVLNACQTAGGGRTEAEGRARLTGALNRGALEVTFVEIFGWWLWPAAGDYTIIALDDDYRWSAVGHPSRDYGWILSREESLSDETLKMIAAHFRAAGYDTCRILTTPRQDGEARVPLCED